MPHPRSQLFIVARNVEQWMAIAMYANGLAVQVPRKSLSAADY